MRRPDDLNTDMPLVWSTGTSNQCWQMFTLSRSGELDELKRLVTAHPELVECQFAYRTPLYFAVRENIASKGSLVLAELFMEHGGRLDLPIPPTKSFCHDKLFKRGPEERASTIAGNR